MKSRGSPQSTCYSRKETGTKSGTKIVLSRFYNLDTERFDFSNKVTNVTFSQVKVPRTSKNFVDGTRCKKRYSIHCLRLFLHNFFNLNRFDRLCLKELQFFSFIRKKVITFQLLRSFWLLFFARKSPFVSLPKNGRRTKQLRSDLRATKLHFCFPRSQTFTSFALISCHS